MSCMTIIILTIVVEDTSNGLFLFLNYKSIDFKNLNPCCHMVGLGNLDLNVNNMLPYGNFGVINILLFNYVLLHGNLL
jgi:hypothetical protein